MNFVKRNNQAGTALTEFAISFPLFIGIVFGIIDISTLMIQKSQIEYAAQESLREASIQNENCEKFAVDLFKQKIAVLGVGLAPQPPKADASSYYCSENDSALAEERCTNDTTDPLYTTGLFNSSKNILNLHVNVKASCYICNIAFGFGEELKTYNNVFSIPLNPIGQNPEDQHLCYQAGSAYTKTNCYNSAGDTTQC